MRPGTNLSSRRVLVVLDALEQRVRAVADADDRDADLVLARAAPCRWSLTSVSFPRPLRERLDDQVVDVALALGRACGEPVLQLRRHAQQDDAPSPGALARAAARLERDGEAGGEDADGDVVEALSRAPTSSARRASARAACGRGRLCGLVLAQKCYQHITERSSLTARGRRRSRLAAQLRSATRPGPAGRR